MNRGQATDAILDSALTSYQRLILLGYMRHMPSGVPVDQGTAYPGAEKLARYAGCTERAVRKHRTALIEAGILEVVHRAGPILRCRIDFQVLSAFNPEPRAGSARPTRNLVPPTRNLVPPTRNLVPSHPEPRSAYPEPRSAEPSPRTLSKNPLQEPPLAAPAKPEPPAATAPEGEPEAPPGPLWQAMGLPKPGKGVPKSLLTQDVLDVWAYWLKVHTEYAKGRKGVGAPRVIGKGDLKAIQAGLRWQPESTAECPDGWTQKRVLCTVLAYAYRAPEDAPGASWWRRPDRAGSDLNPRTLLRLGQDPKLPRNAAWAVAWRLAGAAPTLTVVEGGRSEHEAAAVRLWESWAGGGHGFRRIAAELGFEGEAYARLHAALSEVCSVPQASNLDRWGADRVRPKWLARARQCLQSRRSAA